METVSVIIPIYKVEAYLRECVESVLAQNYPNLEIILVDDGSPDGCPAICDEFASADPRVQVIHKKNGGLSDARNAGMRIATGDYFYFVDSDDRLPAYSVEWMVNCIHVTASDMVIAGFERFSDVTGEVFFQTCPDDRETTTVMTREEVMKDFYRDGCQAWAVLYKREIHDGIFFPFGEINEDEAVVFHLFERCKQVAVTNKVVYSYRNRSESITTSPFSQKKLAWYRHCKDNLSWLCEHHPKLEADATRRLCGSILWSLRESALSDGDYTDTIQMLIKELRNNYHRYLASQPSKTDRIKMWVLKHFPFGVYKRIERKRYQRYCKRSRT